MIFFIVVLMIIIIVAALNANTIIGHINTLIEKSAARKVAEAERLAREEAERIKLAAEEAKRREEEARLKQLRAEEEAERLRKQAEREANEATMRLNMRLSNLDREERLSRDWTPLNISPTLRGRYDFGHRSIENDWYFNKDRFDRHDDTIRFI